MSPRPIQPSQQATSRRSPSPLRPPNLARCNSTQPHPYSALSSLRPPNLARCNSPSIHREGVPQTTTGPNGPQQPLPVCASHRLGCPLDQQRPARPTQVQATIVELQLPLRPHVDDQPEPVPNQHFVQWFVGHFVRQFRHLLSKRWPEQFHAVRFGFIWIRFI